MTRIGILGTGWGGRVQLPACRAAGFAELLLWGRSREKAQAQATANGAAVAGDWREVIDKSDLVFVSTPVFQHFEMTMAALQAGRHVICEKPFALNAGEAAQLANGAKQNRGKLALIDHEMHFLPGRQLLKKMIRDKAMGEILAVEIVDRRPSRSNPQSPWSWWSDAALGGGAWGAIGSHCLDTLRWLLPPVVLTGCDLKAIIPARPDGAGGMKPVSADDHCVAFGRVGLSAIPFSMLINLAAPGPGEDHLTIRGTVCTLTIDGEGRLFRLDAPAGATAGEITELTPPTDTLPNLPVNSYTTGTLYLARALKAALATDSPALPDAAHFFDGLAIQQLLDAGRAMSASRPAATS
jgi:predicted dehydrogenase